MPKLIDADKLKKHYAWWDNEDKRIFDTIIDLQPEAVVRCKDCIYYGDHGDEEMVCAMMILYPNKPTDYCSLGVRRKDA